MDRHFQDIKEQLNQLADKYENEAFIENDPISIPHLFREKQDIEIAAFFAAMISWGQRKTIIANARKLMRLMDDAPYEFVRHHGPSDLKALSHFVHRTFQPIDLYYFLGKLQLFYKSSDSLEDLFISDTDQTIFSGITNANQFFFPKDEVNRSRKHFSSPERKSACKRTNMFLRWMVRKQSSVDFGIWERIDPSSLMIPLDIHVGKVARSLGLLRRKQNDWQAVEELTSVLRKMNPTDPIRYDYSLFSLGINSSK